MAVLAALQALKCERAVSRRILYALLLCMGSEMRFVVFKTLQS